MARPGPKTKLTAERQEKLCQALRGGNFRTVACAWAGISYRTFAEWMQKGAENPTSRLGEFRRAVMDAEKAAEIRAVALIMKAAELDPKHAEWWLSHRHASRWAEKRAPQKHEVNLKADESFAELLRQARERANRR